MMLCALLSLSPLDDAACAVPPDDSTAHKRAADIEFTDAEGTTHRLVNAESGRATVMIFVMRDCPISNYYQPAIRQLHEKFAVRGIRFFVIYTDPQITAQQAQQHQIDYGVSAIVVADNEYRLTKFAEAEVTPETFIWSGKGRLLYRGRIDDTYVALGKKRSRATSSDLQNALEAILAGRKIKNARTKAVGCYISASHSSGSR
jgi:hypothetical protein